MALRASQQRRQNNSSSSSSSSSGGGDGRQQIKPSRPPSLSIKEPTSLVRRYALLLLLLLLLCVFSAAAAYFYISSKHCPVSDYEGKFSVYGRGSDLSYKAILSRPFSSAGLACKRLQASIALLISKVQPFASTSRCCPGLACSSSAGPVANVATPIVGKTSSTNGTDPIASPEWLHSCLGDPNIKVVDASWYMPGDNRNPFQEYKACHIPGALFFDVDGVVDPMSNLPHMLPTETAFAAAVSALGIRNTDTIVIYDGKGIFSAARVWWMFRTFGHRDVFVLDGGLPHWCAAGFDVEGNMSEESLARIQEASDAVKKAYQGQQVEIPVFKATLQPESVWTLEQVKCNIEDRKRLFVDARSKARFDGVVPEPRKGIRGGHVPESKCVPFNEVLKDGATLLGTEELRRKFDEAGVSLTSPIVASCGTGVTACVLALALHRLGCHDVAVYDGSWTEWGGLPDTPINTHSGSSS